MADGTRLRYDGVETYLETQLNPGVTNIEFSTPLTADGGAPIDDLVGDEYLALSILDANYRLEEIVHLVQYSSGSVTGIIERAQEGTSDLTHPAGNKIVHATTVLDFTLVQDHDSDVNAHPDLLDQANAYTDNAIAVHNDEDLSDIPHPYFIKRTGDTFVGDVGFAPDAGGNPTTVTVEGSLVIASGADLVVEGDLVINGRLFLNGIEIMAGNERPATPSANQVHIQTFG